MIQCCFMYELYCKMYFGWEWFQSKLIGVKAGQEKTQVQLPRASKVFDYWAGENRSWWSGRQVKLSSIVLLVDKAWTLHACWASNISVGATENWNIVAQWATGFQRFGGIQRWNTKSEIRFSNIV